MKNIKESSEESNFIIGFDTYEPGFSTYCLMRKIGDVIEYITYKTVRGEKEFQEEVTNIMKYFNAVNITELSADGKKRIKDLQNLKYGNRLDRTQPHWAFLNKE